MGSSHEPGAELNSIAEKKALEALSLQAFANFNLVGLKSSVAQLLSLFGRSGFFSEYTRHDISHINGMLELLEWLIPDESKEQMSPADWLLIVLAIYFHDLGLLVTEDEYKKRYESGFDDFKTRELFEGEHAEDYKHKVDELGEDQAERFYYQEYVRYYHAERIGRWIAGENPPQLGQADSLVAEIEKLLQPLGDQFRDDLGFVCKSHHADDLDDLDRYRIKRAYGSTEAQTANLHYSALLLRTVDLLHMTKDRTPSSMFRTINPTDPISQREWAKQMGVNRVCSKEGVNRQGKSDPLAPRDTVEVHAYFKEPEPFFSLTSFLKYIAEQLKQSVNWSIKAEKAGSRLKFPWRYVDDQNIEAKGFLKHSFAFELDQPRILKLLTGHTLYNDTGVVLRELVQNSLDAVRLQKYLDDKEGPDATTGTVKIHWDSGKRCLTVTDTGTGMTQQIIEDHLLKVGSSRYGDTRFKEDHPDFYAISRFGIGVLSAFMIADEVDIFTCHPDDHQARHLSLRNLLGKYLIRLIDKDFPDQIGAIAPHGTRISLRLRPSARVEDIADLAKKWVVVPSCNVSVQIDDGDEQEVGFKSVGEALTAGVADLKELRSGTLGKDWKVIEKEKAGIEVAFVVKWHQYFRQWAPLTVDLGYETHRDQDQEGGYRPRKAGCCVHGVLVESSAPGFQTNSLLLLANAKGKQAPRTNVARSGIEKGGERGHLWQTVYDLLVEHLLEEFQAMQEERGFTQARAVQELDYLLGPLEDAEPEETNAFDRATAELPLWLVEENGHRHCVPWSKLSQKDEFWTTESPLFSRVEWVLSEGKANASLRGAL